jgi:hypothetical protein
VDLPSGIRSTGLTPERKSRFRHKKIAASRSRHRAVHLPSLQCACERPDGAGRRVKTTLKDCRQWATDAAMARSAAPAIPMPSAQRAWASMMGASSRAPAQCVASPQTGAGGAKNFRRLLALVEKDEATEVSDLNG